MSDASNVHLPSRRAARRHNRARTARHRRRKIQALAAGGLVLGVGATATVASWTDQENAFGEFEAGQFQIEATTDGSWQSSNEPYEMHFDATGMYPGQHVYAQVLIRTSIATTFDGDLTVVAEGADEDLAQHLNYRAFASVLTTPEDINGFTCNETTTFPTESRSYIYGSVDGPTVPLNDSPDVANVHRVSARAQDVVAYCFEVQLSAETPNDMQGKSAPHTWTWNAESVVPG